MKVGVLIEFTSNTDIDAKFAELKEMGVDSCQLVCWDRPTLQDDAMAESINKGLEKYGIHATAFWCGWEGRRVWDFYEGQLTLGLIPSDYRVERLKMLMEGSDFAKKIHVTDLATHVAICRKIHTTRNTRKYWLHVRLLWKNARKTVRTSCSKQDRKLR